ncbi:MAG: acyl-CoA dehydrogenase [Nocardioides sp.]|nr:acyl-CoA dehydrogenase [Nocardioides sp.]
MATSKIMNRRDLEFLLYEWLDVEQLLTREHYAEHDRETFDSVLDLSEQLAEDHFAPLNRLADTDEPYVGGDGRVVQPAQVHQALAAYTASGLPASVFDAERGGLQLPFVVHQAASSYLQAASIGVFAYPFLAEGNAGLLVAHGTPEQVATYADPVIAGRWYGTMALSEPQAGSSLGDLTTSAVRQDDGNYRLTGTKMWISGGDHELAENIVHLVLARTPGAAPGVRGISLFIVPKHLVEADGSLGERNDVALVGLNHKMGYRATTNTLLTFGEGLATPGGRVGAVGHLVGEEGLGLGYMFHMMNEARVSVGAGAVALGYTGYLHALDYARTRTQGRTLQHKDPTSPPVPLTAHPDVRRMLLAQKAYVEGGLALVLFCALLVDESRTQPDPEAAREADQLLGLLTPVAKSWPSQWCLAANDLAIQVHGGYGYTRDHPVEQLYRDNRLNPIHEGTAGIQALDLLGRKVREDDGAALRLLGTRIHAATRAATRAGGPAATYAAALDDAWSDVVRVTGVLWEKGDPVLALANASLYLEAVGHVVVAWLWLEQLIVAGEREGAFYDGKRAAARYFFAFELPTTGPRLALLASLDTTTLDLDPDVL